MINTFSADEPPPDSIGGSGRGKKVTEEELNQWIELRKQGTSVAEIARKFSRQQSFVYQKLKKAGVVIPRKKAEPKPKKEKKAAGSGGKGILDKDAPKPKAKVTTSLPQPPQPLNPDANKPRNLAELLGKTKPESEVAKNETPSDEGNSVGSGPQTS